MRVNWVLPRLRAAFVLCGCLALGNCGPTSDSAALFAPAGQANANSELAAMPAAPVNVNRGDYRIKSDDLVQVVVFQVPDFTRESQVDSAGNIVLPLLGAIPAAGRTPRELEAELTRRLKAKYLQNPQVSVLVKNPLGLRVTVEGSVIRPGIISLSGNMTLLSVLAQSGGFSESADHSNVLVFRETSQGRAGARFDANAIRAGTAPDPPIYGGDTVVANDSTMKSAFKTAMSSLGVVGVFSLFLK